MSEESSADGVQRPWRSPPVLLVAAGLVLLLALGTLAMSPVRQMRDDIDRMRGDLAAQRRLTAGLLDGIEQQLALLDAQLEISRELSDTSERLDGRAAVLVDETERLRVIAGGLHEETTALRAEVVPRLDDVVATAEAGLTEIRLLRRGTFARLDTTIEVAEDLLEETRHLRTGTFARLDLALQLARELLAEVRNIDEKIPESFRAVP